MLFDVIILACLACILRALRHWCLNDGRAHIDPAFGPLLGPSSYVLRPCTVGDHLSDAINASNAHDRGVNPTDAILLMSFTLPLLLASNPGVGHLPCQQKNSSASQSRLDPIDTPPILDLQPELGGRTVSARMRTSRAPRAIGLANAIEVALLCNPCLTRRSGVAGGATS